MKIYDRFSEKSRKDILMDKQSAYQKASYQFFKLFNSDFTLLDVVNLGAELLNMPVAYCDSAYRHRAVSDNYPATDIEDRIRYRSGTNKDELYEQMLIKTEYAQSNTPFIMRLPGMKDRWISKSLYAGCNTGHVTVPDCSDGRFNTLDREMLRIVSDACALGWILLDSKRRFDRDFSPEDAVFERIFKEEYEDIDTFRFQMNRFAFDQYRYFCTFCVSTEESHQITMQKLKQHLLRIGLSCWTTVHHDKVVCLIGSEDKLSIHNCFPRLSAFARQNNMFIAASDIYDQILLTRCHYTFAERQMHIMEDDALETSLTHVNSSKMRLYIVDASVNEPERYCHTAVLDMLQYDRDNGKEYSKTLYLYLKHGLDIQKTADSLFIHKNTVQYRLSKIKERFGVDTTDFPTACQLSFSFELLISLSDRPLFTFQSN